MSAKSCKVAVAPEDENRFVLSVQGAVRACNARAEFADFHKQYKYLLDKLASWIRANKKRVGLACVTQRDAGLLFLVVRKAKPYNREFADALTELDMEIARDENLNLIKLSVLALPKCSMHSIVSFLDPENTSVYRHAK
jgi:hypothetical protein